MVPYQISLREKLEQPQRRATKLVRNIKYKSYEERLSTLNLMLTLDRRGRGDMIMIYNILNQRAEMDARFMKMNQRTYQEIQSKRIQNLNKKSFFFTKRITKRWNGLSQEILSSETIDTFKRAYHHDQEQGLIRRHSTMSSWLRTVNQL